mgnify:CR=1 FL=1
MRLWPSGLAPRLVVLLVSALAVAQAVLVFVLHDEQRGVVEAMAHGQALNQAVTLARLLSTYPRTEEDRLAAAFGSRMTCARVVAPPFDERERAEGTIEPRLTATLKRMLHGNFAGEPAVLVRRHVESGDPCRGAPPPTESWNSNGGDAPPQLAGYSAETIVPLKDGRTLVHITRIETPGIPFWVVALSFFISSLAIAAVVVVSVRHQTRPLRELAQAAEKFGRGEDVPPLVARGPSEIAVAIRAFDTMRDRLHRFVSDRLRLLAAVSHDLRTPLTTLRLKAEFVDDDAVRDDLVSTLDELTAITESTLAFSRAEASHEATETLDLAELAREIVEEFRLSGAEATFLVDAPVSFVGRPVALKRAVRNVVENAIRYGRRARVSVFADRTGATVRVDDDGPGIPEARIEEAFEAFVRIEPSRNRETGGTGLGLSITRSIVHAHGGTIVVGNRPGGGLRLEMTFPFAAQTGSDADIRS